MDKPSKPGVAGSIPVSACPWHCTQAGMPRAASPRFLELPDGERMSVRVEVTPESLSLCGSAPEVMPVVAVDGVAIGDRRPGPTAARLQALLRLRSSS